MNRRELLATLIGASTVGLLELRGQAPGDAQLMPLPFDATKLKGRFEEATKVYATLKK